MFPVLFHLEAFVVHTYGVVLMLAFLVALGRAYTVARRQNDLAIQPDQVLDAGIWMIVAGVLGARLMFVAIGWSQYRHASDFPFNIFKVWQGGLSFHGGLIGGVAAAIVYCLLKRISILKIGDLFAPSVMVAYAIGRLGCLLNGCCYGGPTDMPWGMRFFDDGHWTQRSHPTQLYASLLSFAFFGGLVWLERRRTYLGQIFCWYLVGAAVERFLMEIWRAGTTSDVVLYGLTDVQLLCLGIAAFAFTGMILLRRRSQLRPTPTPYPREAAIR